MKNVKNNSFVLAVVLLPLLYAFDFMVLCNIAPSAFMGPNALNGVAFVPIKALIALAIAILFIKGMISKTDRPGEYEVIGFLLLYVPKVPVLGLLINVFFIGLSGMENPLYIGLNFFLFIAAAIAALLVTRNRYRLLGNTLVIASCIIIFTAFATGEYGR